MTYVIEALFLLMCLSLLGGLFALPKVRKAVPVGTWLDAPRWYVRHFYRVCLFFSFWLPLQSLLWLTRGLLAMCCAGNWLYSDIANVLLVIAPAPCVYWLYRYFAKNLRSSD
jgi:hypothetical protein